MGIFLEAVFLYCSVPFFVKYSVCLFCRLLYLFVRLFFLRNVEHLVFPVLILLTKSVLYQIVSVVCKKVFILCFFCFVFLFPALSHYHN